MFMFKQTHVLFMSCCMSHVSVYMCFNVLYSIFTGSNLPSAYIERQGVQDWYPSVRERKHCILPPACEINTALFVEGNEQQATEKD